MFNKSSEKRVAKEVDKIVSMKENLDSVSWGRVMEIAKQLQEDPDKDKQEEWSKELLSIAQSNMSLLTKIGVNESTGTGNVIASGIETHTDDIYLKSKISTEQASRPESKQTNSAQPVEELTVNDLISEEMPGEKANTLMPSGMPLVSVPDPFFDSPREESRSQFHKSNTAEMEPIRIAEKKETTSDESPKPANSDTADSQKDKTLTSEAQAAESSMTLEQAGQKKPEKAKRKKRFGRNKEFDIPFADTSQDKSRDVLAAVASTKQVSQDEENQLKEETLQPVQNTAATSGEPSNADHAIASSQTSESDENQSSSVEKTDSEKKDDAAVARIAPDSTLKKKKKRKGIFKKKKNVENDSEASETSQALSEKVISGEDKGSEIGEISKQVPASSIEEKAETSQVLEVREEKQQLPEVGSGKVSDHASMNLPTKAQSKDKAAEELIDTQAILASLGSSNQAKAVKDEKLQPSTAKQVLIDSDEHDSTDKATDLKKSPETRTQSISSGSIFDSIQLDMIIGEDSIDEKSPVNDVVISTVAASKEASQPEPSSLTVLEKLPVAEDVTLSEESDKQEVLPVVQKSQIEDVQNTELKTEQPKPSEELSSNTFESAAVPVKSESVKAQTIPLVEQEANPAMDRIGIVAASVKSRMSETREPLQRQPKASRKVLTKEEIGLFKQLYSSRDGSLCLYEDADGHLVAVDSSKLA